MRLLVVALSIVVASSIGSAAAEAAAPTDSVPAFGASSIPPDEATGFVPLPEGDVFRPLLADPKAAYSFVSYVRGTGPSPLGSDIGSVGIGDRFGLVRWGGPEPGEGIQLSLEGAVFAQFDLNTASYDLINADYLVGIPLTFRWQSLSARVRLYHQSSHLGDEFLLHSRIVRENFAFESFEGILSWDVGPLRVYGGGEYVFDGLPDAVLSRLGHAGVELRQRRPLFRLGDIESVRLVAAGDVKAVEQLDWTPAWSARAGFEMGPPRPTAHAERQWSILAEYYDGPSPYGQFYREDVRYYGVGLHFSL